MIAVTQLAGYRILRAVGAGGMAELFLAEREAVSGTRRRVVLKRILPGFARDPMFRERFLHEARVAMQLSHANVVQVYDFVEAEGTYVLVMEYIDGCDLRTLIQGHGPLPVGAALYVAANVLRGLGYAHRRCTVDGIPLEIVHRDVSPGNILLSTEGEVKLTDFGLARSKEQLGHSIGGVKGTFAFMAPEQAEGRALDRRADLFAVGAVLYASLTGESPFAAQGPAETLDRVRAGRYRPLRERVPGLPEGLEDLVKRALSVDVAARFVDAEVMRSAIEGVAHAHGLHLRPDDVAELVRGARAPEPAEASKSAARSVLERAEPSSSPASAEEDHAVGAGTRVIAARPRSARWTRWGAGVGGVLLCGSAVVVGGLGWRRARVKAAAIAAPTSTVDLAPNIEGPRALDQTKLDQGPTEAIRPSSVKERPSMAFVTINADPWARVSIDGRVRGTTPLVNLAIAPGSHDVQLANPELGVSRHTAVRLRAGEHKTVIETLVREER